jgi:transcriptional regulator with XRE-family HTH domain
MTMEQYQAKSIVNVQKPISTQIRNYIYLLTEAHERSGLSLREVAQFSDLDPTYVHYILQGERRPPRDVIIALGFTYRMDRTEVDEILLLAGLPPLGRSALKEYRQQRGWKAG